MHNITREEDDVPDSYENIFEYCQAVLDDPRIEEDPHQRAFHMLEEDGGGPRKTSVLGQEVMTGPLVEEEVDGKKFYGGAYLFDQLYNIFQDAAHKRGAHKMIIGLEGGTGTGKSYLLTRFRNKMKEYSRTEEGRLYALGFDLNQLYGSPDSPDDWRGKRNLRGSGHGDAGYVCPIGESPLNLFVELENQGLIEDGWTEDFERRMNAEFDYDFPLTLRPDGEHAPDGLCIHCTEFLNDFMEQETSREAGVQKALNAAYAERIQQDEKQGGITVLSPNSSGGAGVSGQRWSRLIDKYKGPDDMRTYRFGPVAAANRGALFIEEYGQMRGLTEMNKTLSEGGYIPTDVGPRQPIDTIIMYTSNEATSEADPAHAERTEVVNVQYLPWASIEQDLLLSELTSEHTRIEQMLEGDDGNPLIPEAQADPTEYGFDEYDRIAPLHIGDEEPVEVMPFLTKYASLFNILTRIEGVNNGEEFAIETHEGEVDLSLDRLESAELYDKGEYRVEKDGLDSIQIDDVADIIPDVDIPGRKAQKSEAVSVRFVRRALSEAINQPTYPDVVSYSDLFEEILHKVSKESEGGDDDGGAAAKMQQFVGGDSNRREFFEEYEEIIDELVDGLVAEDEGEIDRAVRYSFAKGIGWSQEDLQRYVDEVIAYVEDSQVMDDYAGELRDPDTDYMEKVENDIPFAEDSDEFRRKIHNKRTRTRKVPKYLNDEIEEFIDQADELRINGDLEEYETDLRTAIFRDENPRSVIDEMTTRYDMPEELEQTGNDVAREILEYRELPLDEQRERADRQVRVTVQKDVMDIDELQEARTPQQWDEIFELESISFEPSDLVKTDEGTIAHSEAADYVEKTEQNLQEFFNFTPQSAELISQEIFKRRAGQDVDVEESLIKPNVQKYKSQ